MVWVKYTERSAMMTVASENLLVKFRSKNTQFGVTCETVITLARKLNENETQVIHMALSTFASDMLPACELDDRPLTAKQIKALHNDVAAHYLKGKLLSSESLFK